MAQASIAPLAGLRIDELEAHFPSYCKAMRLLVRSGASLAAVRRTVCWERLALLHRSLPRQYRDPELLYLHLRREWCDQAALNGTPTGSVLAHAPVAARAFV